jgi:hypothetical protein
MSENKIFYNRDILVQVLIYHQRKDSQYCACGWGDLGKSHPEHVADIYEMSVKEKVK